MSCRYLENVLSRQDNSKTILRCLEDVLCRLGFHCSNYSEERLALLNSIKNISMSILQQSDSKFTSVLLFGDTSFDNNKNISSSMPLIDFTSYGFHYRFHYRCHIISAGRFDEPTVPD